MLNWLKERCTPRNIIILIGASLSLVMLIVIVAQYFSLAGILTTIQERGIISFYAAYIVLILIGVPSTPFYLLASAVFPLWQNLLFTALAISIHFIIAWWLSARILRQPFIRLLARRGIQVPSVTKENEWQVTFLIRFTPGLAMILKSYALGVAGVRLRVFMVVSFIGTYGFAAAFLTMGHSAMEGNTGLLLGGLALMVFLTALASMLKSKAKQRRNIET